MEHEIGQPHSQAMTAEAAVRIETRHGEGHTYDQDGLRSVHNHEFMDDPSFRKAYERGVRATGRDYEWHWRVHVGLWVATCASRLPGDFVECGVNRGFLSSAIMDYLEWDSLGKQFYLLDTFKGMDERFISAEDKAAGAVEKNRNNLASGFYTSRSDEVRANFSRVEESFRDRRSNSGNLAASPRPEDILSASRYELFDARSGSR